MNTPNKNNFGLKKIDKNLDLFKYVDYDKKQDDNINFINFDVGNNLNILDDDAKNIQDNNDI